MIAETLTSNPQGATSREEGSEFRPRVDLLERTEWDSTMPRLILHARWRSSRYGKASAMYMSRAEEYAQEAVKLFLEGTRRYDGPGGTEFFYFLCGCVDSLVYHDVEKAKRRGKSISFLEGADGEAVDILEQLMPVPRDFERDILDRDQLTQFIESLDEDLRPYMRLRLEAELTAAEYAAILNTPETVIRNMDKRIKRGALKWKTQ